MVAVLNFSSTQENIVVKGIEDTLLLKTSYPEVGQYRSQINFPLFIA